MEGAADVGALATSNNTQYTITGFAVAADSLKFDLPTGVATGVTKLNLLNNVVIDATHTILVQTDPFAGSTLVNFGADGNGDLVTVTLAGVTDASTVSITVI
ncbi:hypothetical protein CCP4SC76_2200001 [Gammaproteobacteria bacterium]